MLKHRSTSLGSDCVTFWVSYQRRSGLSLGGLVVVGAEPKEGREKDTSNPLNGIK